MKTISRIIVINVQLWTKTFQRAWEPLPLNEKAAWIFFISNTLAIITIIELIALGR